MTITDTINDLCKVSKASLSAQDSALVGGGEHSRLRDSGGSWWSCQVGGCGLSACQALFSLLIGQLSHYQAPDWSTASPQQPQPFSVGRHQTQMTRPAESELNARQRV